MVAGAHPCFGRADEDVTNWVMCFCEGMADSFANVRVKASVAAKGFKPNRLLGQRQVLSLFKKDKYITTHQIAVLLAIHPRTALNGCKKWVQEGFVTQHGSGNKNRKYELSGKWLALLHD